MAIKSKGEFGNEASFLSMPRFPCFIVFTLWAMSGRPDGLPQPKASAFVDDMGARGSVKKDLYVGLMGSQRYAADPCCLS